MWIISILNVGCIIFIDEYFTDISGKDTACICRLLDGELPNLMEWNILTGCFPPP